MKQKGFTLVEILGVIIILGILGVLAIVTFTKNMKGFREDYYIETVRTLTESGKEFFNDNKKYRPSDILTSQIVPMNTLVSQKYLDEVTDYKGNSCSVNSYVIVIKNGKDDYMYHACLVCAQDDYSNMDDKYCDEAWKNSTSVEYSIATPPELYVYLGTPRSELRDLLAIKASYVKKNSKGEVIGVVDGTGFDETPTIYPENIDTIDTNTIGVYPINYVYQGKTTTGHVTVYKFEEPTFTINKQEIYATDLSGGVSTSLKEKYIEGTWTQKIFVTLNPGASTSDAVPNTVNRYQWNKDGVWQDFCLATACNDKEVTLEMNENIQFRSISVDNKASDMTSAINIKIDNTKPTCTITSTGPRKTSDWYTGDVTVSFTRKEDLVRTSVETVSGITTHNITISSGTLSHTNNLQVVHNYDTGGVKYVGFVEDQARNFIICETTFKRDATNPTCSLRTIGTRETATNPWYNSASVGISFLSKADIDDKGTNNNSSGIKTTRITGNGNSNATAVTDPADTDGVTYTGYVEDNAGNSVTCTTWYKKDSTKPNCALTKTGTAGNNGWHISDVKVSFSIASDNLSNVRSYGISSIDGNKEASQTTDTTGTTYTGYIIDNAGNSNTCSTTVKKDTVAPSCAIAGHAILACSDNTSGLVKVTFTQTDDYTGGDEFSPRSIWSDTKTVTTNGRWYLKAVDDAGKVTQVSSMYCLVKYDKNGGDANPAKTSEVKRETESADLTQVVRRGGYKMIGWNTSSTATTALSSYTVEAVEEKTLYAIYEECQSGQYTNESGDKCLDCPNGYRAGGPKSSESECVMNVPCGSYVETAGGSAKSCGSGYYRAAHTLTYGQTSSCSYVSAGYYVSSDLCTQSPCPTGYPYSDTGATSATQCYKNVAGGYFVKTAKDADATMCGANTYKASHSVYYGSTSSCTNCDSCKSAPAGSSSSAACVDTVAPTINSFESTSFCSTKVYAAGIPRVETWGALIYPNDPYKNNSAATFTLANLGSDNCAVTTIEYWLTCDGVDRAHATASVSNGSATITGLKSCPNGVFNYKILDAAGNASSTVTVQNFGMYLLYAQLYNYILYRGDCASNNSSNLTHHVQDTINNGKKVGDKLYESLIPTALNINKADVNWTDFEYVKRLYNGLLGREPEEGNGVSNGYHTWTNLLADGYSRTEILPKYRICPEPTGILLSWGYECSTCAH